MCMMELVVFPRLMVSRVNVCWCSGKKGQYVWTEGRDEEAISRGIYNTYTKTNLRYSQVRLFQLRMR